MAISNPEAGENYYNAQIKYIKDKNNNFVSPVTSSQSVFFTNSSVVDEGTTLNDFAKNYIKYNNASQQSDGYMSATDKAKLDGIATGADNVSVTRNLTSGTKVGTITINGTGTDLYAPVLSSSNFMIKTHRVTATGLSNNTSNNFYPSLENPGYYPLTIASLAYDASEGGFEYSFTRLYNRATGKCNLAWYCRNAYNGAKTQVTVSIDVLWLKV